MPPAPQNTPAIDASHMLPEHTQSRRKGGAGPFIGVFIIVVLLIVGALYFWGAELNKADAQPLPLIPGESVGS